MMTCPSTGIFWPFGLPTILFMCPKALGNSTEPDDLAYWIKPVSTKNTTKHYSHFVEVMAYYRTSLNPAFRGERIPLSNRTGIFNDTIIIQDHPWKKPESLIEKLITNHYPGDGVVYDPHARKWNSSYRLQKTWNVELFGGTIQICWLAHSERAGQLTANKIRGFPLLEWAIYCNGKGR